LQNSSKFSERSLKERNPAVSEVADSENLIIQTSLRHLAIIPDGNRRWAVAKGLVSTMGHYKAGAVDNLLVLMRGAKELGVEYLSFWGFSTENWKRDVVERKAIFDLILKSVDGLRKVAVKEGIRFRLIGRRDRLPEGLISALEGLEKETYDYSSFNVQLLLDYGGRDEIIRGVNKLLGEGVKSVDEAGFSEVLDSAGVSDVDMIIRTGGEKRLSGLMPFQSVYAELYFCDKMFPDFGVEDLRGAVEEFGRRKRRFGGS